MHADLVRKHIALFSQRAFSLVAVVLVANLALDFLLLNLMALVNAGSAAPGWSLALYEGPCTEAFVLGVFFSQVVMLAVWAALFPGNSPLRLLFATVVTITAAMVFAFQVESLWLQGLFLHRPRGALDSWAVVSSSLDSATVFLLLLYLVQIPLWLLRRVGRMRILFDPSGEAGAPGNGPLRLIDLFAVTSFLAVPLALGRIMVTSDTVSHLFIPVLALSLLMIVFGLPYLWAILGTRHLGIGLVTALVFSEGVAVCGSLVFALLTGNLQPRDWPIVVAAFHATQVATLAMALANGLAVRTIGYRLVWAIPRRAATSISVGGLTSAQPAATQAPQ